MLFNICMKFHEDTLRGIQVTDRTRYCDGKTDGRTERRPRQNNMSPNPTVGRHNNEAKGIFLELVQNDGNNKNFKMLPELVPSDCMPMPCVFFFQIMTLG